MALTVTVDLPADVEQQLRASTLDLDATAKEALLVSLYRQAKLSHFALSKALGLDRFETEDVLHRHNVTEDLGTAEDVLAEVQAVQTLRAAGR